MEADQFNRKTNGKKMKWEIVSNLGKTGSAVTTTPVTVSLSGLSENNPVLEYDFFLLNSPEKETVVFEAYLSPTLNFNGKGLHFAVAIDDAEPRIINMHEGTDIPDWKYPQWFNKAVSDKIMIKTAQLKVNEPGKHTLKMFAIDRGIVFQKFVIDNGGAKDSYLGPPMSSKK